MKDRMQELIDKKKSLKIEEQMKRPLIQTKINQYKTNFKQIYGLHPEMFWENKKHFVELSFIKEYKRKPHRSKAIPMDAEHTKL